MVVLMAGSVNDEWTQHETSYQTKYGLWNGFVARIPVMRQIIDMRAASIFSSWTTKGTHDSQALKMLEEMDGRGNETFDDIAGNMYKIAYICGDSYAEKIYEDDEIVNLEILPSDNIRQVIKQGKIIRFEEIDGTAKWQPHEIFHYKYNPRGALTHGLGMIEGLNNILLSYEQMLQLGMETYEHQGKGREIILVKTDNADKLNTIRTAIKEAGQTWDGVMVLPSALVEDVKDITFSPALKPQEWLDTLSKEIFKATATPELVLGTGYSTSEEDAKTRISGFIQSIRKDQNNFEKIVRMQIFKELWPTNPPELVLSYANEAAEEQFRRNLEALPVIEASQTISPENKNLLIQERLEEMGLIQ